MSEAQFVLPPCKADGLRSIISTLNPILGQFMAATLLMIRVSKVHTVVRIRSFLFASWWKTDLYISVPATWANTR